MNLLRWSFKLLLLVLARSEQSMQGHAHLRVECSWFLMIASLHLDLAMVYHKKEAGNLIIRVLR